MEIGNGDGVEVNKAFSLVELSIVLVILGLLTGGILAGQNLIRAAELRSVTTQLAQIQTAYMTFKDQYLAAPGDMTNATSIWGTDPDGCPTHTNWTVGKKETCDGDGNGAITGGEMFRIWQHMADAGLIEGSYSGVTGPDNAGSCVGNDHEPGYNTPKARLTNAAFGISTTGGGGYIAPGAITYLFEGTYGNSIKFGQQSTACDPILKILTPQEAWNIDTKLDDGKPGMGRVLTRPGIGVSGHPNCNNGDNTMAATATYTLTYEEIACGLYFRNSL